MWTNQRLLMLVRWTGLKGKTKTGVVAGDRNSIRVPVTKVVKDGVSVGIVVTIPHPGNALPVGRNASDVRSPITSRNSTEVTHRTSWVKELVVEKHVKTCMKLKRETIHLQCMTMMLSMSEPRVLLPMSSIPIMQTLLLMRFQVIGNFGISLQMWLLVIVMIQTELSLEFSNSPDNKAARLPLKFESILT